MTKRLIIMCVVWLSVDSHAARYKGQNLDGEKYKATLELDNGASISGKVKFRYGTKATFYSDDGSDIDLKIRPYCTSGIDDDVDDCWPKLKVRTNDTEMNDGVLKIRD